ncbi:MAG: polymer-forming cytoskeletal protein, partial [Polyangiaceae bacterium]
MADRDITVTVIGRATRVRGRVTGESDLEVHGFVEGDIAIDGDVTIDAQGIVDGNVQGRRVKIRGAVKGDLAGEESVYLEEGARVVGDVRAPHVAVAEGALVRGYLHAGESDETVHLVAKGQSAGRAGTSTRAPAAPRSIPRSAVNPAPKVESASGPGTEAPSGPAAAAAPMARRPPPPIVPALKRMKGQMVKK